MEAVQVGVIGAGRIGRLHADNLAGRIRGARLVAVADPRLDAARDATIGAGAGVRASDDAASLLDDENVQAVVICSPTPTHAALIEEAAARGKHVFCEKPIDLDVDRARRAVIAAGLADIILQIGFNRRFDPSFRRVADLVRAGKIGDPHLVRISSRDPEPPPASYVRSSGGLFLDMSIHDLDMARYLAGDEVEEIFATGSVLVDPEIGRAGDVDTAAIVLRYRSGAIGLVDNSRRAVYGYDQRAEVFGSKGCLTAANPTPTEVSLWTDRGEQRERLLDFFLDRYEESYRAEMQAFITCIVEGREPPVTGDDGLRAIELAIAARRSLAEGHPVRVGGSGRASDSRRAADPRRAGDSRRASDSRRTGEAA